LKQIPVKVYTYKVPMAVSLLEDASNIVDIFQRQVTMTLAIDEDEAFLIGDGTNDPHGILPDQSNSRSLTEVNSGSASALTWSGLRKLRRGIDSQYRVMRQASFVGNSASGEDIEDFVDGNDNYRVDMLEHGGDLLGGRWFESEALPDPSASVYPVIFGNFSGYAIVERLGLSVQRYNDSNTGVNKVEFHVRRRIGGDIIEEWKFAVQKCST
jgi:HK97 family phage major capsid protein